ncbi:hypothetical protein ODS41_09750 [Pyrobaculum sp. 3827-6]|uniref:hypothetical protein n=1 Tax=Pyrobaculum sp. 3827-6 TaxID=2983604 RepID=UPI0021D9B7A5|nr:hypothetical protein [Pyrobaculum sp. 3827-6]MCU7788192.1 hypothetical protein [Pyrobaculum sp. 3827-6]
MRCLKQWRTKDVDVCLLEGVYKPDASVYSLLSEEAGEEEAAEAVRQWLEAAGVGNELNVVITDGAVAYAAWVRGAAGTLVYNTPRAKELALSFIHYLENTGRERLVNIDTAAKLESELSYRITPAGIEEKIAKLRQIAYDTEAAGLEQLQAEARGGEDLASSAEAGGLAAEVEWLCQFLRENPDKVPLVRSFLDRLLRDEEFPRRIGLLA